MRGIIYCVHLSGVGHLKRMLTLAKGLVDDCEITFIQAGRNDNFTFRHPNFYHMKLPFSDSFLLRFRTIYQFKTSLPAVNQYLKKRKKKLFSLMDFSKPYDFIITEQIPLTKLIFLNETYSILQAAKEVNPNVAFISSQKGATPCNSSQGETLPFTIEQNGEDSDISRYRLKQIQSYYDKILVHCDPQITRLEETFRYCDEIREKIEYTGYISPKSKKYPPSDQRKKMILVTTGAGSKGGSLIEVLMKVISQISDYNFIFIQDPMMQAKIIQLLNKVNAEHENMKVVDFLDNFDEKLRQCSLAITLAGSTLINIYLTGTPALVYRELCDGGQQVLGKRFADQGIIRLVEEEDLSPEKLKNLILETIKHPPKPNITLNVSGVENTRKAIKKIVKEKQLLS
jgi:predicted glycosyltransferase